MRMHSFVGVKGVACASALAGLLFSAVGAYAIAPGQVDDFQDGSVMNWDGGTTFTNVANGGPAGVGDRYLQVTANGGFGQGSRLGLYNYNQWSGNYLAAGVTAITADLANFGATALELRVLTLFGAGGDYTSTSTMVVPADGVWRNYTFGLSSADLSYVGGGSGVLNDTMSSLPRLMIRHQPGAPGGAGEAPAVVGRLGLDNITAVPEPASLLLLGAGALALLRRRRN